MYKNGFIKVSCCVPKMKLGNPIENVKEILNCLDNNKSSIALFPELSITGYTCGDLFFQDMLLEEVNIALKYFLKNNKYKGIVSFGLPFLEGGNLYNCAIIIKENKILGIIPKKFIPNNNEFYEKRWFKSGLNVNTKKINYLDQETFFGEILFSIKDKDILIGVEICEDMWTLTPPSSKYSMHGANIILNLSASNELYLKEEKRLNLINDLSRRNVCAYLYTSSGIYESCSDSVFSGTSIIYENGNLIKKNKKYNLENDILYADIDISKLNFVRRNTSYLKEYNEKSNIIIVETSIDEIDKFEFTDEFNKLPFVPNTCEYNAFLQISEIQENALLRRVSHLNNCKIIIGVSGGLDSTLALLVARRVVDKLNMDKKDIIAVTMPAYHTSNRTKNNAIKLMEKLGVTIKNIDLTNFIDEHFKLINHDKSLLDITYENAQARIRTLVLMNLANKYNGIVLGTGDMSELALGFCTYNGDQMSMYGINAGLPKTTVRFMTKCYALYCFNDVKDILEDIINTPISPELTDNNAENQVGSYEVNDFILYRYLICGDSKNRINYLLNLIYKKDLSGDVDKFFKRFFAQQFKRQALPDAPKIFNVSLSSRTDYRMPSDIKR